MSLLGSDSRKFQWLGIPFQLGVSYELVITHMLTCTFPYLTTIQIHFLEDLICRKHDKHVCLMRVLARDCSQIHMGIDGIIVHHCSSLLGLLGYSQGLQ